MMRTPHYTFVFVTVFLGRSILADFVSPYPVQDCSNGVGFGLASCPNQEGCCAGGAACCAGGCCPITASCVNQGTSDEGCCPVDDPTYCGASVASYSQPACTAGAPAAKPSVQCVSVDNDWYCPPGAICGARYPLCIGGSSGEDCTSEAPEATDSPSASPESSSDSPEATGSVSGTTGRRTGTATATVMTAASSTGYAIALPTHGLGMLGGIGVALGMVW